jgi:hypothetical protein
MGRPFEAHERLAGIWLFDTPLTDEREGGRVRDSTDWASGPLLILTHDTRYNTTQRDYNQGWNEKIERMSAMTRAGMR